MGAGDEEGGIPAPVLLAGLLRGQGAGRGEVNSALNPSWGRLGAAVARAGAGDEEGGVPAPVLLAGLLRGQGAGRGEVNSALNPSWGRLGAARRGQRAGPALVGVNIAADFLLR